MNIELKKENLTIINNSIYIIEKVLKEYCISIEKKEFAKLPLTFVDFIGRYRANLKSVNSQVQSFMDSGEFLSFLPIGLIMRCCLEDTIQAKYLLLFVDDPEIMGREVDVTSLHSINSNLQSYIKEAPEYWKCPEDEKKKLEIELESAYREYRENNSIYFNERGSLKKSYELRKESANWEKFFEKERVKKDGHDNSVGFWHSMIKKKDKDFASVYMHYRYFCMFEHYTFASRNAFAWNSVGFEIFVVSIEFVYRIIRRILIFLEAEKKYIDEIANGLIELHKVLQKK